MASAHEEQHSALSSSSSTSLPPANSCDCGSSRTDSSFWAARRIFINILDAAQRRKEELIMEAERQGIVDPIEDLPAVFYTFEEVEQVFNKRSAARNPTDSVRNVDTTEQMLNDLPPKPAEPCQACDIKHANFPKHDYHPLYTLTPDIWSALPQDLTDLVVSMLPMKHIIALTRSTITTTNFRKRSAQRHPHLFALMRWGTADTVRATVYDISCNDWAGFDLTGFPAAGNHRNGASHGYEDSVYSHHKGLVCFAPPSPAPILVFNPLTGEWRTLPLLPHDKLPLIVEVTVEDTGSYQVKVVSGDTDLKRLEVCVTETPENSAYCYDSTTGGWTELESGLVFGGCGSLQQFQPKVPVVFDCEKRVIFYLKHHVPLRQPYGWAGVGDSIMVLVHDACSVSEFAWRERYSVQSTMLLLPYVFRTKPPHLVFLFATEKFLLVVGDSVVKVLGKNCQLLQVYDRVEQKWHLASDMGEFENSHPHCLKRAFTCELRWDAVP